MQGFSDWIKRGGKWASNAQSFLGFLPGPVLAVVTYVIGRISEVSPLLLWMCTVIALLVGHIAWTNIRHKAYAKGATAGVALLSASILGHSIYQEHKSYNNYAIFMDGFKLLRNVEPLGTDDVYVHAVKLRIQIRNPHPFSVWSRLDKHYTSLASYNSGQLDDPSPDVKEIFPGEFTIADDDVIDVQRLATGKQYRGEMHFVFSYGRDPKNLNKTLDIPRRMLVQFCKPNGRVCEFELH